VVILKTTGLAGDHGPSRHVGNPAVVAPA